MNDSLGGDGNTISYVEWADSAMVYGWSTSADLERNMGLGLCKSVGFLVYEDTEKIVLALNAACNDKTAPFGEILSIPQACIRKHCSVEILDNNDKKCLTGQGG